jgi:hypothetical protein
MTDDERIANEYFFGEGHDHPPLSPLFARKMAEAITNPPPLPESAILCGGEPTDHDLLEVRTFVGVLAALKERGNGQTPGGTPAE